jgi:hypothetical protein
MAFGVILKKIKDKRYRVKVKEKSRKKPGKFKVKSSSMAYGEIKKQSV